MKNNCFPKQRHFVRRMGLSGLAEKTWIFILLLYSICCFGWQIWKYVIGGSILTAFSDNSNILPCYDQNSTSDNFLKISCDEESKPVSMNISYSVN